MRRYHHIGIPTTESKPGETHLKHLKVFVVSHHKKVCLSFRGKLQVGHERRWSARDIEAGAGPPLYPRDELREGLGGYASACAAGEGGLGRVELQQQLGAAPLALFPLPERFASGVLGRRKTAAGDTFADEGFLLGGGNNAYFHAFHCGPRPCCCQAG